ncbi:MAG: hypothetical protein WAV72_11475 [Bradyrhizobium sp.]
MKLYERFGERGYHTSIITSFGVDFDAYENVVLSRLRGAGCHNNILLCDGALLSQSLADSSSLPRHAGRLYTANGAKAAGVFHPKLFVQLGRKGGRIIVSSANVTATGLAGNLELAGEFACGAEDSGEQRLIARAWAYALRHCDRTGQALDSQIAWAEARTPWLSRAVQTSESVTLADETTAALLTTGEKVGIGERFLAQVDDRPVKRLIVVSPYWDDKLKALGFIAKSLSPAKTDLLIDSHTGLFPVTALKKLKGVRLFDREEFRKGRFLHAKVMIAQTRKADHVLYGSANCTVAALGTKGFTGENEEVCMYRRFPAGTVLDSLELAELLDPSHEVDPDQLDHGENEDELDLDDWLKRTPGRFECSYDTLIWTPPTTIDPDSSAIELLNNEGKKLNCHLGPGANRGNSRHYLIAPPAERPAFAVVHFSNGTRSAPAIVALIDKIREAAKEARSKHTENAASQLAEETEEGLWLLDVLDTLESAERIQDSENERLATKTRSKKGDEDDKASARSRMLTYEEFIAGRKPRAKDSLIPRNSLGGSEMSLVRGFLNRILEIGNEDIQPGVEQERNLDKAFDLGDETANAEEAMNRGETLDPEAGDKSPEEKLLEEQRRKATQRKATRGQIAAAVTAFNERISERKSSDTLTTFDALRLRALLMIVAAAGWAGRESDAEKSNGRTSLQVLPVQDGAESWPRLMGRVLFGFFGGKDPAIRHVKFDALHEQLTDDVLECWATCFWCLHACLGAPCSKEEHAALARHILALAERLYRLTGLKMVELLGSDIEFLMDRMSERFNGRLGLDHAALSKGHDSLVRSIFEEKKKAPEATAH